MKTYPNTLNLFQLYSNAYSINTTKTFVFEVNYLLVYAVEIIKSAV